MATEICLKFYIYSVLLFTLFVKTSLSQLNRPTEPPPGKHPVVANGIVYNLWHIPEECQKPEVMDQSEFRYGATIATKKKKAIMREGGPYKIHGNFALAPLSCLYIEPGTVLYFGPGYGMIINGTLIARGSELDGQRIVMTKDPDNLSLVGPSNPFPQDARLVDGNTTRDGRLELYYMGKWRGVCTNYVNYTKIDANVTCRHLGFVWGNFTYHSFSRNKTEYMLFEGPDCKGTENSLLDCPGRPNIRVGSHICDGQQVIGFECAGLRPDLAKDYWRGLEFYNATVKERNEQEMLIKETLSFLEYLDISYAGRDIYRGDGMVHGRATISASPYVPLMNNVTVTNGAYDGLNFTEIRGRIHIANSTVSYHRGYGAFIETAVGRVLINKTDMDDNWGDGVKMYMKNFTINSFEKDYPAKLSFCRTPTLLFPSYPRLIHEDIIDADGNKPNDGRNCVKSFPTSAGKRLTLHFLLMERDPAATGTMTVYDQYFSDQHILARFPVSNGTFPQSITSITNKIYIQFTYNIPDEVPVGSKEQRCKTFRPCFRILMELWSGEALDEDLRFFNSSASNNNGYGVNVQDMRCKVFVNSSVISDNRYGSGLRIFQGAGEVAVNNSIFARNVHSAINITYAGGYTLINRTKFIDNKGYGVITEYERLNRSRIERGLKMEVVRSEFTMNKWIALRVGNYCKGAEILVNMSHFNYNYDEAIEYLSCNKSIGSMPKTNFSVAFNTFNSNSRHAVLMSPLINSVGRMTNNTFKRQTLGAVRIDNGYDLLVSRWYSKFSVMYEIFANTFTENYGRYCVSLRLTQYAPNQKLYFKFNIVHGNFIYDSSVFLNPRNRANAPIVASSSNVVIQRNSINNPDSVRDIATHLIDPSVIIDGSLNWWGTINHEFIYGRYFDNDDRYNLAIINYYPVLKDQWLYGDKNTNDDPQFRWVFHTPNTNRIGGVLDVPGFTTDPNEKVYHVDKDIYILPGATLTINPGTTLEFENSIGMVVHGRLRADGHTSSTPILFRLKRDVNETAISNRTTTLRLVEGLNEYEGRVEVEIDGEWGTICREEWIEQNSAVVCQQLGLTYNPQYGNVQKRVIPDASKRMLLNRVQCDTLDLDITKCRAENVDFTCSPDQAVFVRCQPPTWSGVTIPGVPTGGQLEPTQIRYVTIENAGLLDYEEMMYTAALRIDYNFYKITGLIIRGSVSDGVNIKYSNPYTENLFEFCKFDHNQGNGLVTKSPDLKMYLVTMNHNVNGGLVYDPFFTEYEALSVRNFIHRSRIIILNTTVLNLGDNSMVFIQTEAGFVKKNVTYVMQLVTSSFYRVTLQLLDYNPLTKVEQVIIRDGGPGTTKKWEIERDLVDFPVVSTTNRLTIELKVNGILSGRLTFAAHARQYSSTMKSHISLLNCTMQGNYHGIITRHYNNPSNEKLEIFHRIKSEEIKFDRVRVLNNMVAMYIPSLTKYTENLIPTYEEMTSPERVGEITYIMNQCWFVDNERGIVADHNHVDFANNVWHWHFLGSHIRGTKTGGLEIDLPRVNDIEERKFHSVDIRESFFIGNKEFALTVAGYYANVTVQRNNIQNNLCKLGLLLISGMEKDLSILRNDFSGNTGKYMIELDLKSHSEYSKDVHGSVKFNRIWNNRPGSHYVANSWNYPSTYSVALKGVQNVVVNRNLIDNNQMQYELIAGINSLSLDSVVNVKENWWGTPVQTEIRQRIFDFDDWNNYAIAKYFPHLTSGNDINGQPSTGTEIKVPINLEYLGGRIYGEQTLPFKGEPYIVVSDITIMPGAKWIIQPGTEFQFHPNVGILVLGQLKAKGLPLSRIKFRPVISQQNRIRRAGNIISQVQNSELLIRLRRKDGAMLENEGFLQLYNTSTKTWNLMCDSSFNEKTAEVVCREMGLETVNVDVRFTHLFDYYIHGKPMYFLKEFWSYSYYCRGDEQSLDFCMKRINYDIQKCVQAANYTFIRCGERNLPKELNYWGNIRIAPPSYEEEISSAIVMEKKTILEYVDIEGAGILHGEKVGAIQAAYKTPILRNINITQSVSNAIDVVAPRHDLNLQNLNITHNLGYGINVLVLNGESKDVEQSSFIPLSINTVPYHLYGLVDICKMEKEIIIKNRLIIFFKYSQMPLDCVKIVKTNNQFQKVALRFLQFNLYHDAFYRNVLEIFDGDVVTSGTLIGELVANSSETDIRRRYMSTSTSLSVHIHASTAYSDYGFIAEIVTSPLSGLTYPGTSVKHTVKNLMITKNQDGAILYKNVGEVNPSIQVDMCMIENNGVAILNLTSKPVIDFRITDTVKFNFEHSFVHGNKGGMQVLALAQSQSTSIRANITNNVFSSGTNGETLNISGHHYNRFYFYENYIHNNLAGDFRDTIHFQNVVVNFTFNTVINNTGHHILRTSNAENTGATQRFLGNNFIENNTTAKYRSVIKVGTGKPIIRSNFLLNEDCEFELQTGPKKFTANGIEIFEKPVDAQENWWGSERRGYINGKIYDSQDNTSLVSVQFDPFKVTNLSLVDGKCSPGWHLHADRCFRYMGAALTYDKAIAFCEQNDGFLAEVKDRHEYFRYLLRTSENAFRDDLRVWVYSDVAVGFCSSFEDTYVIAEPDCHLVLRPFICQKEPYLSAPGSDILNVAIGVSAGVFGTALIVIIVLVVLWKLKSKRRKDERFERRSSIRSSMRSRSNLTMLSDAPSKRRIHELDKYSVSAVSSRSRYDSDEKSVIASEPSVSAIHLEDRNYDKRRREMNGRAGSQDHLNERNGHIASRERFGSHEVLDSYDRRAGPRDRLNASDRKLGSRDKLNDSGRRYGSRDRLNDSDRKFGSQDRLNDSKRHGSQDKLDSGRLGSRDKLNEPDRFGSREGLNGSNRRFATRDGVNSSNRRLGDRTRTREPDKNFGSQDRLDNSNRKMGSQDRLNEPKNTPKNGSKDKLNELATKSSSQDRLNNRFGSRDRLLPEAQVMLPKPPEKPLAPKPMTTFTRNYDNTESPGSTLERKLIKHAPPSVAKDELEMYTTDDTYDGYSTNEFDDTTSVEDENEKKAFDTDNDDTHTVISLNPSGQPRVENEIDTLRLASSIPDAMYDNRGYQTSPSIEYGDRSKSLSSFSQPNSPVSPSAQNRSLPNYLENYGDPSYQSRPPTPPPPLPVDSIPNPVRQFRNSPTAGLHRGSPLTSQSSENPVPVPRSRPVPPPRPNSFKGSKDSFKQPSREDVHTGPVHLSRESLDFLDNRSNLQDHQICDISKSEDSLGGSLHDQPYYKPGNDNLAYLHGSREHLPSQYNPNMYSDGGRHDVPHEMSNMDYIHGNSNQYGIDRHEDYPQFQGQGNMEAPSSDPYNTGYTGGSRNNLNYISRSRENIGNIHDDGTIVVGGRRTDRNTHAVETDV